jgi:hypothetical protein
MRFPHDIYDANLTPRYVTSSDVFILVLMTVYMRVWQDEFRKKCTAVYLLRFNPGKDDVFENDGI